MFMNEENTMITREAMDSIKGIRFPVSGDVKLVRYISSFNPALFSSINFFVVLNFFKWNN